MNTDFFIFAICGLCIGYIVGFYCGSGRAHKQINKRLYDMFPDIIFPSKAAEKHDAN
jgi:hypothetical protein